MSYFYEIISTKLPPYLYELIPPLERSHRYSDCFQTLHCRTTFFLNSLLPFTITEWNKLDTIIKNIDSHAILCKKLSTFKRPLENDTYGIYDPLGVRLLNRLRLGFSHLRKHKFRHNFADTLNLLCLCSLATFMNDLNNINSAIASLNPNDLLRVIL